MIGIYKIVNPMGKIYIGQSINIPRRKSCYKGLDKKTIGPKIYNSLKKYGWESHQFLILEECSKEELHKRETYWKLETLKTINGDITQALFCNIHDVGSFGPLSQYIIDKLKGQKRTPNTKKKMSEAKLNKPSNFKGKKHSEESKTKMREAKIGKPSNRPKTPIIQYDLDGKFIKEWDSITSLINSPFSPHAVRLCCKGKQKQSSGCIWEYKK